MATKVIIRHQMVNLEERAAQEERPVQEKWGQTWATSNFTVMFICYLTAPALAQRCESAAVLMWEPQILWCWTTFC